MKTLKIIFIFLLTPGWLLAQSGQVIYSGNSTVRTVGEKIYKEVTDEITIPDEDLKSLPKYEMGKDTIPVGVSDVVKLADTYFKKTLGVSFSQDTGFIEINLSSFGSSGNYTWFYNVSFDPFSSVNLPKSDHSEYIIAVMMNGKIYPAVTTVKEITDDVDPRIKSGIPYLLNNKRAAVNPLEKELSRLYALPVLKTDGVVGVYTAKNGNGVSIFYPDGVLFSIYGSEQSVYKIDKDGKVSTARTFGKGNENLTSFEYVGTIENGTFVQDHGDYADFFYKKE